MGRCLCCGWVAWHQGVTVACLVLVTDSFLACSGALLMQQYQVHRLDIVQQAASGHLQVSCYCGWSVLASSLEQGYRSPTMASSCSSLAHMPIDGMGAVLHVHALKQLHAARFEDAVPTACCQTWGCIEAVLFNRCSTSTTPSVACKALGTLPTCHWVTIQL